MPLSASSVDITNAIIGKLTPLTPNTLAKVYYGDTKLIPKFPAAIVESGVKDRSLEGSASTHHWQIILRSSVLVLVDKVQDAQLTKQQVETLIETVESTLNADLSLNGLVIYGTVTRVEPGYARREGVMLRASRLSWEGLSRQTF